MRRVILAGFALVAAAAAFEVPIAEAQVRSSNSPSCIRGSASGARAPLDCTYADRQQCAFAAQGAGGSCIQNPNYRPQSNNRGQDTYWDDGTQRGTPQQGTWGWGGSRR